MSISEENSLLTEQDVSRRLSVSLATVRKWRVERRGPTYLKVGALVRYRPADLSAWLASLPKGGGPTQKSGT